MQVIAEQEKGLESLLKIQDNNPTTIAPLIPSYEQIFDIDLSKRTIQTPDIVTIQSDHRAETIFFRTGRYFDNMDLTSTICIIQYINAKGAHCVYAVPYYDITTFSSKDEETGFDSPMILFPWNISSKVSEMIGTVTFSVRFFKLDSSGQYFEYNLNTLPTTLTITKGLDVKLEDIVYDEEFKALSLDLEQFLDELKKKAEVETLGIYWKVE